ncbi:MAG TPA: DinB family protein [Gemmata sp.]
MSTTDLLAAGYRMGRQMVHWMTDDLTDAEFAFQPVAGANSAAWIVGHLAVTARRTAERLGATDLPPLTEEFVAQYSVTKKAAEPHPELGTRADLFPLLDRCVDLLIDAARALPPEALSNPPANPGPFASNYGEAVLFGAMHFAMHCGQLSTIRRALGKPPLV